MGGGHQNFFSGHPCMPSASFLEGRVAACSFLGSGVATRPYHTVCPTPIPVVCLSLVIRAAHTDLVRPLSFRSATLLASHFAFQVIRRPAAPIEFCRPHAPTGLELDPIHYLEVISCTAQFAFRLTGDPEHATTLSCLQRLVVVACLLTLAAGIGAWGVGTNFFSTHPCMPSASFAEGRVAA